MKFRWQDPATGADLLLVKDEPKLDHFFFGRDRASKYFTVAWNQGTDQNVIIDGESNILPANHLLTLMFNQSFTFAEPEQVVAWRFNREFYCIVDHDTEVSCVGFLFGTAPELKMAMQDNEQQRVAALLEVFMDEMKTTDQIQHEMLLVLLKRLIILVTRIGRNGYAPATTLAEDKFRIVRQFNLLVERHYRAEHSVQFYANELNKSPKTLANSFALYNHKTPIQMIQERIIIEAKRLLRFTSLSVKEVAYELGFEDAAHFSRFFKKNTGYSPLECKSSTASGV